MTAPKELHTRTNLLRTHAHAFCTAFLNSTPPTETLNAYFTSSPRITEHGPAWSSTRLPFLGKTFSGRRSRTNSSKPTSMTTCDDYFSLLASTLSFHPTPETFPPAEEFLVDAVAGAVSVVGHARFGAVKTGRSWDERFVYRLSGFDEEGRIGHWEIWADPLSAWEAVGDGEEGADGKEDKKMRWGEDGVGW